LLESSSNSIAEIAEACGFTRDERLRRAFVRSFGITPSQYRIHFRSQQ
jgi:transcriptional regulator GlxA family with amidase domain